MTALRLLRCTQAKTSLLQAPHRGAEQVSQLLFGESCKVVEQDGGWMHVCLARDSYTGWVADTALSAAATVSPPTTYHVGQPSGLIFTRPDIKSPLLQRLYLGSPLDLKGTDGDFHELESGGYVHRRHVTHQPDRDSDFVEVAMWFVGSPYLWGGRTCDGIDCSALVQTALHACGFDCPRDTGAQHDAFAASAVTGPPQRGDLVYFPGHVGIMVDAAHLLHANAFWMSTVIELLSAVTGRFQPDISDPIVAVIRPT